MEKAATVYVARNGTVAVVVSGRDLPPGSVRMPIPAVPYSQLTHPHCRLFWKKKMLNVEWTERIINRSIFSLSTLNYKVASAFYVLNSPRLKGSQVVQRGKIFLLREIFNKNGELN